MIPRREKRYEADFPVQLQWQLGQAVRRAAARCLDLSASGAKLETRERIQRGTVVLVHSDDFGRMGLGSVRYCNVKKLNYNIGVFFSTTLQHDPARRRVLDELIGEPDAPQIGTGETAAAGTEPSSERDIFSKQFI